MGLSENCNGRKRPAEEQEHDDGYYKRLCRSARKEYGLCEVLEDTEYKNKVGMECNIDSDDIFVYTEGTGISSFIGNGEQLIINGDLSNGDLGSTHGVSPRECYTSSGYKSCPEDGYGANLLSKDLHKDSDEVGISEVGVSCYEPENPLEGLDLFFDDVGLDFGIHEEDGDGCRQYSDVAQDNHAIQGLGSKQLCSENVGAEACPVNTEQAFIEENEVHDWLFSSDQTDSTSLEYCNGDVLEPSLAHLLEGMAGA